MIANKGHPFHAATFPGLITFPHEPSHSLRCASCPYKQPAGLACFAFLRPHIISDLHPCTSRSWNGPISYWAPRQRIILHLLPPTWRRSFIAAFHNPVLLSVVRNIRLTHWSLWLWPCRTFPSYHMLDKTLFLATFWVASWVKFKFDTVKEMCIHFCSRTTLCQSPFLPVRLRQWQRWLGEHFSGPTWQALGTWHLSH